MKKFMFACPSCKTVISINTQLDEKQISQYPPCPCGKTRMINMSSYEYAYGEVLTNSEMESR